MTALTARFAQAVDYAAITHGAQRRKGTDVPYLSHLLTVAGMVLEDGGSEDEAIAALLHDSVEDQGGAERLADVRARFGEEVARIVAECTDYDPAGQRDAWRQRKQRSVAHIAEMDPASRRVMMADKLHNARSILRDYRVQGEALWERFNAGRDAQLAYQRALADAFAQASDSAMAADFRATVDELERRVAEVAGSPPAANPPFVI